MRMATSATQSQRLTRALAYTTLQLTGHIPGLCCNVCKEQLFLGDMVCEPLDMTIVFHTGECARRWVAWRRRIFFEEETIYGRSTKD